VIYGPQFFGPAPRPDFTCGSCGQPVAELKPCTWDSDLAVGPCCQTHPDVCESCGYDHADCRCPARPASIPWTIARKPAAPAGAGLASIGPGLYVRTKGGN